MQNNLSDYYKFNPKLKFRLGSILVFWISISINLGLGGCSTGGNRIDYKSVSQETAAPLELPPDLNHPVGDYRYSLPSRSDVSTYSQYAEGTATKKNVDVELGELLPEVAGMKIMRDGNQRWLVVNDTPEVIWPLVRQFWQENGFVIARDQPEIGLIETDWAENRAQIPGFISDLINKVLDTLYSYPERDKFRTRIERGEGGNNSEIYIVHSKMEQIVVKEGRQVEKPMWQVAARDPELEIEFIYRLMYRLGAPEKEIEKQFVQTQILEPRSVFSQDDEGMVFLTLSDNFAISWRRVGIALDRAGFSIVDRNRSQGIYYLEYRETPTQEKRNSILSMLAFWRKDAPPKIWQFELLVSEREDLSTAVRITRKSKIDSDIRNNLLQILNNQLK